MTETTTILLPLPRIVTGERVGSSRNGPEERLCVIDSVPVPVRSVTAAQAPLALRLVDGQTRRSWHAYEGGLYAPLFEEAGDVSSPEAVHAALLARAADCFGSVGGARAPGGETLVDYRAHFEKAHRNQGLKGRDGHRMRSVSNEGIAGRDAEAARLAGRLLLVDGVLMHPIPMPFYLVERARRRTQGGPGAALMHAAVQSPYENPFVKFSETLNIPGRVRPAFVPPEAEHPAWMVFEPWRGDEAREFAASLPEPEAEGRVVWYEEGAPDFEVVDRVALESAAGDRGLGHYAGSASTWFLKWGTDLYRRPDAVLETLIEHRRDVAAIADGASAEAAMESLRAYAELFVASDRDADASPAAVAARAMMSRYDEYERPRAGLEPLPSADMAELGSLAR